MVHFVAQLAPALAVGSTFSGFLCPPDKLHHSVCVCESFITLCCSGLCIFSLQTLNLIMEIKSVNPKGNQPWIFIRRTDSWSWISNTFATQYEELTPWKRPWCWERVKWGEGDNRRWDGWMAIPTWWTWVWASSGSWWWTGKPGVLQSMGSQRVGHNWETELNWTREEKSFMRE